MTSKQLRRGVLLALIIFTGIIQSFAQTVVQGVVTDIYSKQPLQYVSVVLKGGRGTVTDSLGRYKLTSSSKIATLQVTYVGYLTILKPITPGITQTINFELETDPKAINSVTVTTRKRAPYRNKGNPAVELIRRVIANKPLNRTDSYNYVQYEQYEKMQVSISNVSDKLANSKLLKNYKFLFENRDTTKLEGKALLPVYLEETLSQKYYRKKPEKTKTIVTGEKRVNFGEYIDNAGVSSYLNRLYMDVDIYDNDIPLFTYQFLSPIADLAPTFYMYYIRDTTVDANGHKLIKIYFTPRNTNDLLFRGNMWVTLDGNYSVEKINMFLSKNVNLNFVRELHIDLDFEKSEDSRYHLSRSNIMADASVTKGSGTGFFGERTVSYRKFKINQALPDSVYDGPALVKKEKADKLPDDFWKAGRHDTLTHTESKVYSNIDSLEKMPSFRRTLAIATFLLAGYTSVGPFEIGPAAAFYSFNPVEGFKLRLGGRTTPKFSKRLYFETYGAYGFKDERWKGFLSTTYSLNNKSIYSFPLNYVRVSYQHDTKIPGQELQFVAEDNFLLSFKRGKNDKWLYNSNFKIDFVKEFDNHLSFSLGYKNWKQEPAGAIIYNKEVNGSLVNVNKLITSEFSGELRWAPKEQFYQGKVYRIPIINKYPIFTLRFIAGVKGLLNSEYNYQNISARFEKRAYMSQLGYSDLVVEGGYIFGKIPYPLMTVHRANQTYAYQLNSYNLMNFQEFVSDRFLGISVDHHFNGLFFNRVPLLKKLKLREVVSVKVLYGGVRDENDPAKDPSLIKYPIFDGSPTTFALNKKPYIEGSVGIANIFKLIRVDLVKRFNYLENPYVASLGVRARFKFDF
ncbi:MAG: carboxypeptidase-like regulatory domain-containing protein [Chitinophagaceae bacterium]|nr:carboxypeptidase-like regulatory domain-containing protein [Bacteroidota bacterium]TAJ66667.1 MAG: carboxypeptidase-like regulatory domain-containing protein [Chitinophagaceae bacterium]